MSPQESHNVVNMFEWGRKTHEFIEEVDNLLLIHYVHVNRYWCVESPRTMDFLKRLSPDSNCGVFFREDATLPPKQPTL